MCMGYAKEIQAWICEQERQTRDGFLGDWFDGLAVFRDTGNQVEFQSSTYQSVSAQKFLTKPVSNIA